MKAVAYTELLIFLRVTFGALLWQNSLLTPLIYAHFLRQRYHQSKFTAEAVNVVQARIDQEVRKPGRPPALVGVWEKVQVLTRKWAGTTIERKPNGRTAPAAPAAAR